ncbi:hypothetical protein H6P81_016912 [Aristolochia fimbriata]|uniref:EF-hand domain-containing protein n=1 Tax=Aristolochia fimbriata TaxID=158543 RepID=A0AAV7DXL1_ARIFI|nr:hypothetical protein H6P81_016912 [Aristolochia fimbriata]
MSPAAVVYPLLATAFLFFLIFSSVPLSGPARRPLPRRLAVLHAEFDPLVAAIERRREGEGKQSDDGRSFEQGAFRASLGGRRTDLFSDEEYDNEDFEEGYLNVTRRLVYLFPLLDMRPQDGEISFEELGAWNEIQASRRLFYKTRMTMEDRDENGDGVVTLREYLRHFQEHEMEQRKAEWWEERFHCADADKDEALNFVEFNDFLHPEDSKNPKVQEWFFSEKIRELDQNHDGKLSYVEFLDQAYEIYWDDFKDEDQKDPEEIFVELDTNIDQSLSESELKPIIHKLFPGEFTYAAYYTKKLMQEADDNKNGKLSLAEMLDHPFSFYNNVYQQRDYDNDDDDGHDEF